MKSQHTVQITQVDNGVVVTVGCMSFAYTEPAALLKDLEAWFKNPQLVERQVLRFRRGGEAFPEMPEAAQFDAAVEASGYTGEAPLGGAATGSIGRLRTHREELLETAKERAAQRAEDGSIRSEVGGLPSDSPLRRS